LQQNYDAQAGSLVYFEADQSSSSFIHSLQQQQQQLGFAVILLQLLLFFSFEPCHVLQSFQFVVNFSSNQIAYSCRTTTTTTTTEPSTTMQQKTYPTYYEAPAPAPAFGKRRSCRVPLETP
jgi:hypothetical protein